jgi:hypothetical protein
MRVYAEYVFDVINRNWKTELDYGRSMCPEVTEMLTDLLKTKKWYWGDTWGACILTMKKQFRYSNPKHIYGSYSRKAVIVLYASGTKYPDKIGSKNLKNGDIFHYHAGFVCFDKILDLRLPIERKRKLQKLNSL